MAPAAVPLFLVALVMALAARATLATLAALSGARCGAPIARRPFAAALAGGAGASLARRRARGLLRPLARRAPRRLRPCLGGIFGGRRHVGRSSRLCAGPHRAHG